MELSLYAITKEQQHLEELLIETGGELTPELEEALAINQENFLVKAENYGYSILRIRAYIAAIEEQEKRLAAQKKVCKNAIERMKDRLAGAMVEFGTKKVEQGTLRISLTKSQKAVIDDEAKLPADCIIIKTEVSKADVKRHLAAGEEIGAHLEDTYSIKIA